MSLFNWSSGKGKATAECPRCLGKGHVDMDDIRRLKNELKWLPGKCAYCNGSGKVDPDKASKLAPDTAYLAINLPIPERMRLFENDPGAMERARIFDRNMDDLIREIRDLFYTQNLEIEEIAEHFFQSAPKMDNETYKKEKQTLIEYITQVVHATH